MSDKNNNQDDNASKYFDPKQYSTIFVSAKGETEFSEDKITNLINLLTDPANRESRHDVLSMLRSNAKTALPMLIQAIESPKSEGKRNILVASCWEAELNCSPYLVFFTELAIEEEYLTALEAITVIENMAGPFNSEEVASCTAMVKESLKNDNSEKASLLPELLNTLQALPA